MSNRHVTLESYIEPPRSSSKAQAPKSPLAAAILPLAIERAILGIIESSLAATDPVLLHTQLPSNFTLIHLGPLLYFAISLLLSWAAVTSIRMAFGLPISTWTFFALMVSPFPWWYFS